MTVTPHFVPHLKGLTSTSLKGLTSFEFLITTYGSHIIISGMHLGNGRTIGKQWPASQKEDSQNTAACLVQQYIVQ